MSDSAKKVAITFDDGPNPPYTNQILDILKKADVKATFFVCGTNAKRHPQIVKRTAKEGHLIGNHTYNHQFLTTVFGTIYQEVIKTQIMINELTGQKEKLFRFPFLISPFWIKNKLKKEGFRIFGGIVGNDWEKKITADQISEKILSQVKDRSIIILHDGQDSTPNSERTRTVQALKQLILALKAQNYQFVQVDEINPQ